MKFFTVERLLWCDCSLKLHAIGYSIEPIAGGKSGFSSFLCGTLRRNKLLSCPSEGTGEGRPKIRYSENELVLDPISFKVSCEFDIDDMKFHIGGIFFIYF